MPKYDPIPQQREGADEPYYQQHSNAPPAYNPEYQQPNYGNGQANYGNGQANYGNGQPNYVHGQANYGNGQPNTTQNPSTTHVISNNYYIGSTHSVGVRPLDGSTVAMQALSEFFTIAKNVPCMVVSFTSFLHLLIVILLQGSVTFFAVFFLLRFIDSQVSALFNVPLPFFIVAGALLSYLIFMLTTVVFMPLNFLFGLVHHKNQDELSKYVEMKEYGITETSLKNYLILMVERSSSVWGGFGMLVLRAILLLFTQLVVTFVFIFVGNFVTLVPVVGGILRILMFFIRLITLISLSGIESVSHAHGMSIFEALMFVWNNFGDFAGAAIVFLILSFIPFVNIVIAFLAYAVYTIAFTKIFINIIERKPRYREYFDRRKTELESRDSLV